MKLLDSLRLVWRNLWRMKLRTVLTSIGVMIGTAAIVGMVSLSIGLKDNALKSLENFGNLTELEVHPAFRTSDGDAPLPPDQIKQMDWQAVAELKQVPGIEAVMPVKRLQMPVEIKVGRLQGNVEIMGVDVREAIHFKGDDVEKGSFLSGPMNEIVVSYQVPQMMRDVEREKREARRRNVSGGRADEVSSMRGMHDPYRISVSGEGTTPLVDIVGQTATLVLTRQTMVDNEPKLERKEVRVRVVGQLMKEDNRGWSNVAYVPMELVRELNEWANPQGRMSSGPIMVMSPYAEVGSARVDRRVQRGEDQIVFDSIFAKVESREQVEATVERLLQRGYDTWSPARQLEEINRLFMIVQLILGGIAAISLLVATIGIINTMIMSILERTREIGIMKVIGATVYNIRWLFLIESGTIGMIGGLAGLGLAAGAVAIVNAIARSSGWNLFGGGPGGPEQDSLGYIAVIPVWLALFAIGFSFVIGVIAGLYPAYRASRLSALQAIRSE